MEFNEKQKNSINKIKDSVEKTNYFTFKVDFSLSHRDNEKMRFLSSYHNKRAHLR